MIQSDAVSSALQDDELIGISNYEPVMTTAQSLEELFIRFFLNLLVCFLVVHFLYYPKGGRRDYVFTFISFSSAMLLLLYTMGRVDVGVGLTLGLFAIFGVIRYRTETVPVREMTYLFIIIALSAVNGLAPLFELTGVEGPDPHYELVGGHLLIIALANAFAFCLVWVLESSNGRNLASKLILYDRIELIDPARREELVADLEKRCGVKIEKVEVGNLDFLKDAAYVKIYYRLSKGDSPSTINDIVKEKQLIDKH